jgi:hypothetical protein
VSNISNSFFRFRILRAEINVIVPLMWNIQHSQLLAGSNNFYFNTLHVHVYIFQYSKLDWYLYFLHGPGNFYQDIKVIYSCLLFIGWFSLQYHTNLLLLEHNLSTVSSKISHQQQWYSFQNNLLQEENFWHTYSSRGMAYCGTRTRECQFYSTWLHHSTSQNTRRCSEFYKKWRNFRN